jgi:hypothetical protein
MEILDILVVEEKLDRQELMGRLVFVEILDQII